MDKNKYYFEKPLMEGLILDRPNRFLMNVKIGDRVELCHCPSTGKISDIHFRNIPCLLSEPIKPDKNRRTKYTVEAISLNSPDDKKKNWIGINQNRANRYVEFLFRTNQLPDMIDVKNGNLEREKQCGQSKLDFFVNDTFVEVKSPLIMLPLKKYYVTNPDIIYEKPIPFNSPGRFIKHISELSCSLDSHKRAIMLTLFAFDAKKFRPPKRSQSGKSVSETMIHVQSSIERGVEMWQVNLRVEPDGVTLKDYFPVTF